MSRLVSWFRREDGQAMVEYGIIVALISIAAITVITLIGPELLRIFGNVLTALGGKLPS